MATPHLKCIALLLCEVLISENQQHTET